MFLIRLALRILFGIIILVAALLVVGDFYARSHAEKLVSQRIKAATGAQSVSVKVKTFPFVFHVLFSSIPEVEVVAKQVPDGRVELTQVTVDARGVKVDRNVALSSRQLQVDSIRSAKVTVLLTGSGLGLASSLPSGAAVAVVGGHLLEVTYQGKQLARIDLSVSPLVPACSYDLAKVQGGYSLSCTLSPVPVTLLHTLSSKSR